MFFRSGFSRVTMDDLAARLGVVTVMFTGISAAMADPGRSFVERISFVLRSVGSLFASISPLMIEDLRRYAPHVWRAVDEARHEITMKNFAVLLRGGVQAGVFRSDLDIDLVLDMFISQSERLINPEALLRSGRTASETLSAIIRVFFQGLLTDQGRAQLPPDLDLRIPPFKEGQP